MTQLFPAPAVFAAVNLTFLTVAIVLTFSHSGGGGDLRTLIAVSDRFDQVMRSLFQATLLLTYA
ncbi:hypothetical protein AB3R30_00690 [Leptolyngbyaceae cyanobacterium UHCC 1019]